MPYEVFDRQPTEAERVAFFAIPRQRRAPAVRVFITSVALSILLACISWPLACWMSDKRSAFYAAAIVFSFPF
jgi:hypothetical protein